MNLKKTIVALDFKSLEETKKFLEQFNWQSHLKPYFVKVGMQLFYAEGEKIIRFLQEKNLKIFLDLKLHDIPNTVRQAVKSLSRLNIDLLNVHASGGTAMMESAREAVSSSQTKLIAVTLLTSLDQATLNKELCVEQDILSYIKTLANNAKQAGLDGVVCSAQEAISIKQEFGENFLTICPGIRFTHEATEDQKRVTTPQEAFGRGADFIVMGRSITNAINPTSTMELIG